MRVKKKGAAFHDRRERAKVLTELEVHETFSTAEQSSTRLRVTRKQVRGSRCSQAAFFSAQAVKRAHAPLSDIFANTNIHVVHMLKVDPSRGHAPNHLATQDSRNLGLLNSIKRGMLVASASLPFESVTVNLPDSTNDSPAEIRVAILFNLSNVLTRGISDSLSIPIANTFQD